MFNLFRRRKTGSPKSLEGYSSWGFRMAVLPNHSERDISPSIFYNEIGKGSPTILLGFSFKYDCAILAFTNTTWQWKVPKRQRNLKPVTNFYLQFHNLQDFNGASPEELDAFSEEVGVKMVAEGDSVYTKIPSKKALGRFLGSLSCGRSLTLSDRNHSVIGTYSLEGAGRACVMWSVAMEQTGWDIAKILSDRGPVGR